MTREFKFDAPEPFRLVPEETTDGEAVEGERRARKLAREDAEERQRELGEFRVSGSKFPATSR